MQKRIMITAAVAVAAVLALAGCAGGSGSGNLYGGSSTSPSPSSSSSADAGSSSTMDVGTASSSLGEIIVDGKGMTAYFYDKDTANSGESTCTGECAALWPAIESASTTPVVEGVTATVGTIEGVDGGNQITIDGRPIYTYANDSAPGDVKGQGVLGIWFVVSPSGEELTSAAPTS